MMSQQGDQGEEAQNGRGGALDSLAVPLPLGFKAEMSADFLEDDPGSSALRLPCAFPAPKSLPLSSLEPNPILVH
jgi:hypothetical protein